MYDSTILYFYIHLSACYIPFLPYSMVEGYKKPFFIVFFFVWHLAEAFFVYGLCSQPHRPKTEVRPGMLWDMLLDARGVRAGVEHC